MSNVRTQWSNIQVSAKELIAVVIFVVSMSGIYYKVIYQGDGTLKFMESYIKVNDARLDAIENNQKTQNKIFEAQLLLLMDEYKANKAVADYKKTNEFVPLKQK